MLHLTWDVVLFDESYALSVRQSLFPEGEWYAGSVMFSVHPGASLCLAEQRALNVNFTIFDVSPFQSESFAWAHTSRQQQHISACRRSYTAASRKMRASSGVRTFISFRSLRGKTTCSHGFFGIMPHFTAWDNADEKMTCGRRMVAGAIMLFLVRFIHRLDGKCIQLVQLVFS